MEACGGVWRWCSGVWRCGGEMLMKVSLLLLLWLLLLLSMVEYCGMMVVVHPVVIILTLGFWG